MKAVNSSLLQNISGSISATACFTVCLTYFIFKDIRNLRYVELVFYVAVNDFIASIGMALGGSETGSGVCWFQAIVTNVQYLTAMFWTTVIAYQLWLAVDQSKTIEDMTYIHLFCWFFPILISFLPLSTNTFGNADDTSTWCFVSNTSSSPSWGITFWDIFSFYLWVWVSTLTSFYFILSAWFKLKYAPQDTELQQKSVVLTKIKVQRLILYPVIVSVCWVVATVTDIYDIYNTDVNHHWANVATLLCVLQGLLFSTVFFVMNPMIRHKWLIVFENIYYCLKGLIVKDIGGDRNNSKSTDRGTIAVGSPVARDTLTSQGRGRSFAYSIEDEPDYIKPRSSRTNHLSDAPEKSIELQTTYGRGSIFSSSAPTGLKHGTHDNTGPIRNPVQQTNVNLVVKVDTGEGRDSDLSDVDV